MPKAICVYSSSSNAVPLSFFAAAEEFGELLARRKISLVYGGATVGLMGALAKSVHRHGGHVIGVIPRFMRDREIAYEAADELILTHDLRERKAIMESRADAFVALPGGFGTLEEILEILTLRQLQSHAKPVGFLNTDGFYDPLLQMFERLYEHKFTKAEYRHLYHVAAKPAEMLEHLVNHRPPAAVSKWT
ncbi:MAG: TIGR00730 family Rossman fold protein [Verrucomicrobia bacterium]|nr:TIGR00730 family Rossman fold protein [Verrucomicrobiota bacterium]